MGFSLKKAVQSVAKVVTAPVAVPLDLSVKALDKIGATDLVANTAGIDLHNLNTVAANTMRLESSGTDATKAAAFDSAKIGLGALGGAGVISGTTAAGGFLLATKAQQGGGVDAGDIGSLFGIPTSFGGMDFGGLQVLKAKAQEVIEEVPEYIEEAYQEVIAPKNRNFLYVGILILTLGASIFIIRKIRK